MTKELTLTSTVSEMRVCTVFTWRGNHFIILEQIPVFIPRNWQLSLSSLWKISPPSELQKNTPESYGLEGELRTTQACVGGTERDLEDQEEP